ncbi:MAG TPA: hypothetical protein VJR27_05140 [Candidatus Saccharimonadales bacterium]|nr:hypothetical protein [Candidatus Saccharimonadales bacterium]
MLFEKKKIPCFVLIFDQVAIIKKTLEFLATYKDRLDVIALENPSDNTPEIKKIVDALGATGGIKRHYLFDKNITSAVFTAAIKNEAEAVRKNPYVVVTDGDVVVTNDDWLKEEMRVIKKHDDVFAIGTTLDKQNLPLETFPEAGGWIPEDIAEHRDYFEVNTGAHLLLLRGQELLDFVVWKDEHNLQFVDGALHRYAAEVLHKKWARTKHAKAYHLTWDLYFDRNHPYTKMKLDKGFKAIWHHSDTAGYKITEY